MKKLLVICLATMICISCFAPALALDNDDVVYPNGTVLFSSNMPKVSGTTNQYNPYALARPGIPEQVSVGFTLYKVVNGDEIYVTSASNSSHSNYVKAEDFVNLSSGTYKLYAYYQGETTSDGSVTTYHI
jgi:hypothetical protein